MNYQLFGRSGLRVSPLCLGTMSFGKEWGWGSDYETSKAVFDVYANAGGNFVDTANYYTQGTSEKWLGEFINADRDHFVLATKYSLSDRDGDPSFSGNHRKNLIRSVEESLKRMNTDYIDLLWLHICDGTTPVQQVMRGLDDLICQGKVHYIGISATPAWIVSQGNMLADLRGWTSFVGLQIEYSLIQRTPERDLIPMAKAWGMTVTPWGPLAGGALTGKYLKGDNGRLKEGSKRLNDRSQRIAQAVVDIANSMDVAPGNVALRWMMQHPGVKVIPIVGATKAAQMQENLGVFDFELTPAQIAQLNDVSSFELGFPHDFMREEGVVKALGSVRDKIDGELMM